MKRTARKNSVDEIDESLRVLLLDRPGYPIERQRADVAALGLGAGVEYVNDLPGWLGSMRLTDTAIVPALHLLAPPLGTKQPTVIFDRNMHTLMAARPIIIEASTNTKSTDPKAFAERIKANRDIIRSGRHMTRRAAKKRGAMGAAKRQKPLTTADRWALVPAKVRDLAEQLWLTRGGNDVTAWEAVNELLVGMGHGSNQFGSPATARRVIGNRPRGRG